MRILVVDDSVTIRMALVAAFRNSSTQRLDIQEAGDATSALRIFKQDLPDIVFLDMLLGNEKGLDLLRTFLGHRPGARIVLMTGLDRDHPDVIQAISDGAFGYLQKPVRSSAIHAMLALVDSESGAFGRII